MESDFSQDKLFTSFLYHFLPGLLTGLVFFLFHFLLRNSQTPALLAFLLAVTFIDIPVQLGILFARGRKTNGKFSLKGILAYQEKLSFRKFALFFAGAFVVIYAIIMLVTPINAWLQSAIFSALPAWMLMEEQSQYYVYGKSLLIGLFSAQLLITGFVLPWVEETYFRGFLLPRLSRFGKWAAVLNGFFFACYHIWQPQGFLTVFLLGTSLAALTLWKQDLRLPISLHITANVFSRIAFLIAAINM